MSVRHKKRSGWDLSLCIVEWMNVMSHREGFAMLGLTGHYLFTRKKVSVFRDLDTWQRNGYHAIALRRTTYPALTAFEGAIP